MAIDSRIAMQGKSPQASQAINIFENALMNSQTRDIRQQQADQQAALQPFREQLLQQQVAQGKQQANLQAENRILRSVSEFGTKLKPVLQSGDTDRAQGMLTERLLSLQEQGLPTEETVSAITAIRNGNTEGVIGDIDSIQTIAQQRGLTGASLLSVGQRDFNSNVAAVEADPKLKTAKGRAAAIALGLEAKTSSSAAERIASDPVLAKLIAELEQSKSGSKARGKGEELRKQSFIDNGVEAADSVNNIKRSLELLESVKTGGFDNASMRIKQFFGVEGADEGELSARLGISVLSQLKPIFGAAFTAAEGERLERISARFGANPETNKRLLNDALKIAERSARRGIKAAESSGDDFAVGEIQGVLDSFKSIKEDVAPTVNPSQKTGGVIMTDAQGNRATVYPDGTFEEL